MIKSLLCTATLASFFATGALAHDSIGENVNLVFDQPLPNVPGKSMRVVLVEYEPGGTGSAHTHPNSAFIYARVLEGAIRSKVNDGPVTTYRAGEAFAELPGDRHGVSENASRTELARLLAVFVVDTDETELTTPYDE